MKLLLDTLTFLWLVDGSPFLSAKAQAALALPRMQSSAFIPCHSFGESRAAVMRRAYHPIITRGRRSGSGSARRISSRTFQGTLPSPKAK